MLAIRTIQSALEGFSSRRDEATIAQPFKVGENGIKNGRVPKGRLNPRSSKHFEPFVVSAVPSGLKPSAIVDPTLKGWAIFKHPSGMPAGTCRARDLVR